MLAVRYWHQERVTGIECSLRLEEYIKRRARFYEALGVCQDYFNLAISPTALLSDMIQHDPHDASRTNNGQSNLQNIIFALGPYSCFAH